jgi:pimeloyl-ACP methyl ester carboxylesterase
MAFVDTAAGLRLAYETTGSGEPSMVFVHGWCCDRSFFAPQIAHFAAKRAVAALDLRGHGHSQPPPSGEYDVAGFAEDVLAVSDDAGLDRPIVVGHSLGGLVALACAARPDRVRAAVMVDPALDLDGPRTSSLQAAFAADVDGSRRTRFVSKLFHPADAVRREEIVSAVPGAASPTQAAAVWRAIDDFDARHALGQVEVPLLSISSQPQVDLRQWCPTVVVGQTVGAGHFHQLEVPDQVNPMIERFLTINDL